MANSTLVLTILKRLAEIGVTEYCVCPGRRNAPFVLQLEKTTGLQVYTGFEERSAAFFALGCSKRTGKPTAICTTSGTACAELLPAVIEAHYSGIALILITCDRPRRLRGTGAPQTIDQVNLFGSYVSQCIDVSPDEELPKEIHYTRSLHINVCFDEPLLDATILETKLQVQNNTNDQSRNSSHEPLSRFLQQAKNPLVMLGPIEQKDKEQVGEFIAQLKAPVLAEASSQLRGSSNIAEYEIQSGNTYLKKLLNTRDCDSVLRIGGVPAARVWRDLDESIKEIPVFSVSHLPYVGLGRGELLCTELRKLDPSIITERDVAATTRILVADRERRKRIEDLFLRYPKSEPAHFYSLSGCIGQESHLYLGNSLPIREWDLAAHFDSQPKEIQVNRGANGIDGQLSTFLGWAKDTEEAWAILGDLTALYDLSAPWWIKETGQTKLRIVVINNSGGQIFSRMFQSKSFLNSHTIQFGDWAHMWGIDYLRMEEPLSAKVELPQRLLLEIVPDLTQTSEFWKEFDKI